MNCLPPRKQKRKRKHAPVELTKLEGRWGSCNIDTDVVFSNGTNVDGFLGLEELHDYDEDEIKAISKLHKKKKKKTHVEEQNETSSHETINTKVDDNTELVNIVPKEIDEDEDRNECDVDDVIANNCAEEGTAVLSEICNVDEVSKEINDASRLKEATIKRPSKKERRKAARKESFKQKLKERRKKYKEMKKAHKKEANVTVNEICQAVLKESESFEIKSNIRNSMSEWLGLGVPDEVMKALADLKFTTPTCIQKETLPHAIFYKKDVIGAAETGSGKTLAFGIPLIKNILDLKENNSKDGKQDNDDSDDSPLYGLIISPTRELALQIKDHIDSAAKYANIQCVAVVGGLATAKQERLLTKCPEIVVGTPGRLHKLLMDGCEHLNKIDSLKYLVIDEADRMLEQGHFKELNDILDMINRVKVKRQIFVFSATLTLPQHHKRYKKEKDKKENDASEMQLLIDKTGLSPKAEIIDLTTKHITATQLQQFRIMCTDEEKMMYLVYFLLTHPGRSIVFVNSIACTRRLCSLLTLLNYTPLQLHAGKQQRQRLKYLERFTASENGLLIATDVAARGLDIPKVCNVIHFQLPSDPKVYIHRSGRTARASESGISFILQGPEDFSALKKICTVLKLGKDIPSLSVDRKIIEGIKTRVLLARDIDREEHKSRKESADNKWLKNSAASMDIEIEEMEENILTKNEKLKLNNKHKQLQTLLREELRPSGFSGCYPTQSGNLIVSSLKMCKQ